MNIIILGPPGSGKGTQAKKIAAGFGFTHICTGDILREKKFALGTGDLVNDDTVIQLVKEKIDEVGKDNLVFDGFPRTLHQAQVLKDMLDIDAAFLLQVPDEEIIKRIVRRGLKSGRADDNEEIAKKRIGEYMDKTYPIKQFYSLDNKLRVINGTDSIEDIFNTISDYINGNKG